MSGAEGSSPSAKKPSIDPEDSSICRSTQSSATMSGPRVQRCTKDENAAPWIRGSKLLMKAAGDGPINPNTVSIDPFTLATRPNASAAAQNPATSRSEGDENRRTRFTGSVIASAWLNSR